MAHVVFLRAANVGGRNAFSTTALAKALAPLDVRNLGAAGTFVVRRNASAATVKKAFVEALPVDADVIVAPAGDVLALAESPLAKGGPKEAKPFLTALASKPTKASKLPLDLPADGEWQLRLAGMEGPFVVSLRRAEPGKFYPNEIVEKALGVRATTRAWSILAGIRKAADAE